MLQSDLIELEAAKWTKRFTAQILLYSIYSTKVENTSILIRSLKYIL